MNRNIKFYIVDVFGKEKYTGNQLAVFIDEIGISPKEMQQIAHEINYSETTFVNPKANKDGSYTVRIFTPAAEVDFAGHPTLGSAYIIHKMLLNDTAAKIELSLKVGKIKVVNVKNILWMSQIEPVFGKTYDTNLVADLLNISINDIDKVYPIEEVSTGLPFTIVPLTNIEALKKCIINPFLNIEFIKYAWAKGILVFAKGGYTTSQALMVRVFVNYLGIPEDPATGSANGCLAGYLVKHKYFKSSNIYIVTGQGYEINRPSELYLRAHEADTKYNIKVGGKSILVAEGLWQ